MFTSIFIRTSCKWVKHKRKIILSIVLTFIVLYLKYCKHIVDLKIKAKDGPQMFGPQIKTLQAL